MTGKRIFGELAIELSPRAARFTLAAANVQFARHTTTMQTQDMLDTGSKIEEARIYA